jgi:RND family efflux transporter MFP subunit
MHTMTSSTFRTRPRGAVLFLLAALAVVGVAAAPADDAPRLPVPTVVTASGVAPLSVELDGVLQAVRQATVTAQVGGNVLALRVKAGDVVKRGQSLVTLDSRDMRAGVARDDAAVAQAEAELRNADLNLKRQRDLLKSGFVSQAAVDLAESQFKTAQAAVLQMQAARQQSVITQGFSELNAPFAGVVLATHVEAGDLALPGRALVTLYEPGRLRAVVQVPASRVASIGAAPQVQVLMPDGRALAPAAREWLPTADPVSQTVEWRLLLPAEAAASRPGQTVQVTASGGPAVAKGREAPRLTLPAQAVLRRGELTAVYVASAQGFALRAVRLASGNGATVEVLAGLSEGERVALDPVRAGLHGAVPAQP